MPTFDDRENAFENQVRPRRGDAVQGRGAAQQAAGRSGPPASSASRRRRGAEYAREVVRADFQEAGDEDVYRKVAADLGNRATEAEIRAKMSEFMLRPGAGRWRGLKPFAFRRAGVAFARRTRSAP